MARNEKLKEITIAPLYQSIKLSQNEMTLIFDIVNEYHLENETIDIYCIHCKEQSIFKNQRRGQIENDQNSNEIALKNFSIPFGIIHFVCTRNTSHYLGIMFLLGDKEIIKIGQFPSKADIEFSDWDKFSKIIPNKILQDIKKACGLASHGIGAGSFVYLRRVIEYLISDAYQRANISNQINLIDFEKLRVLEKIERLKDYLPKLLFENKEAYSILSKGVHELSEEECINYFDLLENTIQLILDEILSNKIKLENENRIKQKIKDAHSTLKNS